ncbi:MAG TPA: ATP-binding protein [Gemmatimonadaceae bacterium]|nr:ATP-binding protein [Gemmatimonadaceae bacterium]
MTAPLPGSLLAEIIGISADAIICVDGDQRITFFNEGAVRIFGYAVDEVMGQPLDILLPASARSVHHEHMARFARSAVTARRMGERQEIAGRRKNGEEFPAEAAIAKLKAGSEIFASVVLRDVTERKHAERRQQFLLEVSELLASSLDVHETLGLIARLWIPTIADQTVVEMTHRGELYHLRAFQPAGKALEQSRAAAAAAALWTPIDGCSDSADPVQHVPVDAALRAAPDAYREAVRALEPRTALAITLEHAGEPFGRVLAFSRRAAPLDGADLILARDLARRASIALENARLHDHLQWALRARDDTMSVVSHDLRNPVNAVKMLAGAVLQPAQAENLPGEIAEQVRVIQSAAQQMDTLIQDLLDMSRAEAGRFAVDAEPVPASDLLRDALRTLAPLAADKNVAIVTEWNDPLPDVQVDPERIAQVVSNVVGNAIKFTPPGGRICVSAIERPDAVVVSVQDTGPGISAHHLAHVFDRYWQSSRKTRGAGLGLPIAKAIVEAHQGRIWAESVEGHGATFHFTLPR